MRRRQALACLIGLALSPQIAAASSSHDDLAAALFDLYARQSVRLSIANAVRQRPPGTTEVLAPHIPSMLRALDRHRPGFAVAMRRALQAHVPDTDVEPLMQAVRASPPTLDERQRSLLFATDAEFRREAQTVIGAMTTDIALMIAASLGEQINHSR